MELIHKLGIDWKLLIAQTVNFAILLFLLAKFVYRPVLSMMEKRSRIIEKGIVDAKAADERLARIEKFKEEQMAETQKQIGAMIEHARQEAEEAKKGILVAAESQADDLLRRAKLQMAEEKEKMIQDVKNEMARFVIAASAKIMEREFSEADQKRLSDAVAHEVSRAQ